VLDLWTGFFPNYGRGIDGFMNVSTLMPLNAIPSVPMITNAAGVLKVGERGAEAGFLVLESQHSPTTVGFDFPNGVTLLAVARKYTDFGGQPGSHTLLGTYATGDYTSFDTEGWIILPPGGVAPAEKAGTWSAAYLGEQRLWVDPCNAARYTSLFGYLGFSDVETSPFEWTASLSVEAFGPLVSRPADRTGVAYFYNALNDDFQEAFTLVTPVNDVHGAEFYYNAEITPWFHLTADVQVIDPTIEAEDTAVILGARARLDF
jgi:porin